MTDYKSLAWDGLLELSAYVPGKPVKELQRELGIEKVIKLASNENPYGASQKAINALKEYEKEITRYPIGDSFYLRQAISEFHNVSIDNIVCGAGSDEIIQLLYMAFLSSDTHVIAPSPSFSEYELLARGLKSSCLWVDTNNDFSINFDNILNAVNDKTRFIMLANPNNPTGTLFGEKEFINFMDKLSSQVLVVLDEAYIEFAEGDYPDVFKLMKKYNNLMTMRTFSKAYGLASIRCGYLVADKECISLINRIRPPFNVNSAAQIICAEAIKDQEHIKKVVALNKAGKEYIYKELTAMGLEYVKTDTNFMLIKTGDGKKVFDDLLKKGVIVRFLGGDRLKEYIRVSIGTDEENKTFINELKKVLNK